MVLFICAEEKIEYQLFEMSNKKQITFWMLN